MNPFRTILKSLLALLLAGPGLALGQEGDGLALLNPPPADGPVRVRAAFYLLDVVEIDDEAESFGFSGILSLRWRDPRLAFDTAAFGADEKVFTGEFQFREKMTAWYPEVVLLNAAETFDKQGPVWRVAANGDCMLIHMVTATAEAKMDLRRYPYDAHKLMAYFKVLGFSADEVLLVSDPEHESAFRRNIHIPQWHFINMVVEDREVLVPNGNQSLSASTFVISVEVKRDRYFIVRLLVAPLAVVVMLSWSVFWMDASSLGDRMSVSFVGILAAVAYQIVIGDILPKISYYTPIHAFINLSFLLMCLTVVVNLRVGGLDREGKSSRGDRLDRRCRWAFPVGYITSLSLIVLSAIL